MAADSKVDTEVSHSHGGVMDAAFFRSQRGLRATRISMMVLLVLSALQMVIALLAGSTALLADTLHTITDVAATLPLWVAFSLSLRQATRRFPYGYGRAEDLAGLAIVISMVLSALFIVYQSILRLTQTPEIDFIGIVMIVSIIGFIGNEAVAQYRIYVGKQIGSAALVADGYHARTDGLTSLLVLVGAIFVWIGSPHVDPMVGIVISVIIIRMSWISGKSILARLMDSVDDSTSEHVRQAATGIIGVEELRDVRMRWMGHRLVADISIAVNPELSVAKGHVIAEEIRKRLVKNIENPFTVNIHVSPHGEVDETYYEAIAVLQEDETIQSEKPVIAPQEVGSKADISTQDIDSGAFERLLDKTERSESDEKPDERPLHLLEISWPSAFRIGTAVGAVLLILFLLIFSFAASVNLV